MAKTIGNPLTWLAQGVAGTSSHIAASVETVGGKDTDNLVVNVLTMTDLKEVLALGIEDFKASRADVMFICLLYPFIGVLLVAGALNLNLVPLLFPIAAGFAILGPLAAVGLYEISRRREAGDDVKWIDALGILRSPGLGAIVALGAFLIVIFMAWLMVANMIYNLTLGPEPPVSNSAFIQSVFTTAAGWALIVFGMLAGFFFALGVLATSVVSFPLVLDRPTGVPIAIATSINVFRKNPKVISAWGLIVAGLLFVGSVPFFVGLIIVLPILGHATWHLYRRAVS